MTSSLPNASSLALGKEQNNFFQKISLPSASKLALGKEQTIFLNFFLQSASNKALSKGEDFVF